MATEMDVKFDESCSHCPIVVDRRALLRKAALTAAAALVGLGAARSAAFASTVRTISPDDRRGTERSYRIPTAESVYVDSGSEVILARWQNRLYAFSLACPHRGATLEWRPGESRVFCPRHKARFRTDGAHDSGRASRDLDRFDIHRIGDSVVVNLAALRRADTDAAAWAAASVYVA